MYIPVDDDDIFIEEGICTMIDPHHGDSQGRVRKFVLPWVKVRAIRKFISRGGIWKNCPIKVDRWTFAMILYDMKCYQQNYGD